MRVKRYQDLVIWQLADQMRVLVLALTDRDCYIRDLKLHSQTEDAVNSVCRNVAEGFGCRHKEFARFLEISRRSLNELTDALRAAQLKKYITAHDYEPIWRLSHRLYPAYEEFVRYLRTTPDPDWVTNPTPPRRPPRDSAKRKPTGQTKRHTEPGKGASDPRKGASTDPAKPASTDPPKAACTNPPKAASTDPRKAASTDPAKPACTNPPKAASTNPRQGAFTNPSPTSTDPRKAASTDPRQPAFTNPPKAASTDPHKAASTDPAKPASTNRSPT